MSAPPGHPRGDLAGLGSLVGTREGGSGEIRARVPIATAGWEPRGLQYELIVAMQCTTPQPRCLPLLGWGRKSTWVLRSPLLISSAALLRRVVTNTPPPTHADFCTGPVVSFTCLDMIQLEVKGIWEATETLEHARAFYREGALVDKDAKQEALNFSVAQGNRPERVTWILNLMQGQLFAVLKGLEEPGQGPQLIFFL